MLSNQQLNFYLVNYINFNSSISLNKFYYKLIEHLKFVDNYIIYFFKHCFNPFK